MADEVTTADVVEVATGAKSFTGDNQTTGAQDVSQVIEAAKFTAAQKSKKKQGIQFIRLVPPGARGDC